MALITSKDLASLLHSPKSLKIDFLFELQHPEGSGAACHGAGTPRGRLQPARSEPVLLVGIDCAKTTLWLFIFCIYLFGTGFLHFCFLWGLAELEFTCFGESALIDF